MKQVGINYRSIREGILKKMQIKSREKYYQQHYGVPFTAAQASSQPREASPAKKSPAAPEGKKE